MKKRIAVIIILLIVIIIIIAMSFRMLILERNKINNSIKQLPRIEIMALDSLTYNTYSFFQNDLPLIVVYFHPECEFCSAEIEELLRHKNEFDSVDMLFVSVASIPEIKKFTQVYPLNEFKRVVMATDYTGEFVSVFNIESSPMVYIYDHTKRLKKKFKGLIPYAQIKKYIMNH